MMLLYTMLIFLCGFTLGYGIMLINGLDKETKKLKTDKKRPVDPSYMNNYCK